jgi:hypothetical protein
VVHQDPCSLVHEQERHIRGKSELFISAKRGGEDCNALCVLISI